MCDEQPYTTTLTLTGCKEHGEFTCDNGHCIQMEERCNQLVDCQDGSDEKGCQLLSLADGYKKVVSPIARVSFFNKTTKPVFVNISLTLLQLMGIDERSNTIDLQFEITLEWMDQRITYNNLKKDIFLNALSDDEIRSIWLPIVIYANTAQKETTRLGWVNEWSTSVVVSRDGNFTR